MNSTTDQKTLGSFYIIFHVPPIIYTVFLAVHAISSKSDHNVGHKSSLNKCEGNAHQSQRIDSSREKMYTGNWCHDNIIGW